MPKLRVFNMVSLDGYIADKHGDMSWAHRGATHPDAQWDAFVQSNAQGGGQLLFGRVTYDLMIQFWPTPAASQHNPAVAERMNNMPKIVFSNVLKQATWNNTKIVSGNIEAEIRAMKAGSEKQMVILGSASIVSQLTQAELIDEYQFAIVPVVLGGGKTMFEGVTKPPALKLTKTRTFENGNVVTCYEAVSV